jgi:hypothetical protein
MALAEGSGAHPGIDSRREATPPPPTRRDMAAFKASARSLDQGIGATAWMEATGDPLLEGPVPVPPGAVVNDPSQASPNDPLHTGSTL